MPTIRKIRTVVRSKDAPVETDYMVVSLKKNMKGSSPVKPKLATLPIKYFLNEDNFKCIQTYDGVLTENEFQVYFCDKYEISPEIINITKMHREPDGYKLFLVFVKDFDYELTGMTSSISLELFKLDDTSLEVDNDDVFQKVIKYHEEVGTNFRKNQFTNSAGTTKVKPLKLWKTMTGTL